MFFINPLLQSTNEEQIRRCMLINPVIRIVFVTIYTFRVLARYIYNLTTTLSANGQTSNNSALILATKNANSRTLMKS